MLVVDTYNVLHVTGVLPPDLAGVGLRGLVGMLQDSRYRSRRTLLVCDGRPRRNAPRHRIGAISIRFSGPEHTADDVIERIVERSSSPRAMLVVSSDREIRRTARRRRCRLLDSPRFLHQLVRDGHLSSAAPPRRKGRGPKNVFPADVLDDAAAILEADAVRPPPAPPEVESPRMPHAAGDSHMPERPRRRPAHPADLLSPEVIAEAERMLRDADARFDDALTFPYPEAE